MVHALSFASHSTSGGGGGASSITADQTDSQWTASNTTTTITCFSRTLTVPASNPGDVKLSIVLTSPGAMKYSKNSGSYTTFTQDTIVNFKTSDTLSFRITGSGSGSSMIGPVKDNSTGATIGNVSIQNTL